MLFDRFPGKHGFDGSRNVRDPVDPGADEGSGRGFVQHAFIVADEKHFAVAGCFFARYGRSDGVGVMRQENAAFIDEFLCTFLFPGIASQGIRIPDFHHGFGGH